MSDEFPGDFPTNQAVSSGYREATLNRAIEAYKFFYPTVSGRAVIDGNVSMGVVPNKVFGILDSGPEQILFTTNADTPYGAFILDLRIGPLVIELPPGPLIVVAIDVNQRWVADMGLPGPDAGKGGKHVLVPPGIEQLPEVADAYVHRASSNRQIVAVRVLPVNGDVSTAQNLLRTVIVYPLDSNIEWAGITAIDLSGKQFDGSPVAYERGLRFWEVLHQTLDEEPVYDGYRHEYGLLGALGIAKGEPFEPDAATREILEQAARVANDQMRVRSFSDQSLRRVQ